MSKGFAIRFIIYGIIVAYIILDIRIFKGPMYDWVLSQKGTSVEELKADGVVATVYGQPIFETQVKYRMQQYLYVRGRSQTSPEEYPNLFKYCLEELILEHLLRVKTHHNERNLPTISAEEFQEEIIQDEAQFSDEREKNDALARQGYLPNEMALRAKAHIQQGQYLNRQINVNAHDPITESQVMIPELRRIRHIFHTTWDKDHAVTELKLQEGLGPIRTGWASFTEVSDRINEDPKVKKTGGDLGWVSADRLPEGLAKPIFTMQLGESRVIQSKIGWHYIEVLEIQPAHKIDQPDLFKALKQNDQRAAGLDLYLRHLRTREDKNVVIIWDETTSQTR